MFMFVQRLLHARKGATAIEYGLIMALVTLALIGGLGTLGNSSTGMWGGIRDDIVTATEG